MSETNKVVLALKGKTPETLVDLTSCTITENSLGEGLTAHDRAGNVITGTIPTRSASDVSINNDYYTVPAGIYSEEFSIPVASRTLNDNSWDTISRISRLGLGSKFWSVGDTKEITLQGRIGSGLTFLNFKTCVYILGFNHAENGVTENGILWGGFKSALTGGVDIALCDSSYNDSSNSGIVFNMNHWGASSHGGWKGCDLRYDILGSTNVAPSGYGSAKAEECIGYDATMSAITNPVPNTLMSALPSDFRNVLRLRTHYTNNKGNIAQAPDESAGDTSAVVDTISLLSEYEIFGSRTFGPVYEQNAQSQMTYYSGGGSPARKKHNATSTGVTYFTSSPARGSANSFCTVISSGAANVRSADISCGICPVFLT